MLNCLRILWTRHFWKTYSLFLASYLERQHFKIIGTLLMKRTFPERSTLVTVRMLPTQEQSYCDIIQSISVCDPWGYGTETAITCSRFQDNVAPDLSQAKLCLTQFTRLPKTQDITFLRQTMGKVSNKGKRWNYYIPEKETLMKFFIVSNFSQPE